MWIWKGNRLCLILYTTNPIWIELRLNLGRHGDKTATKGISNGMAGKHPTKGYSERCLSNGSHFTIYPTVKRYVT
jgi:hypothetical protein